MKNGYCRSSSKKYAKMVLFGLKTHFKKIFLGYFYPPTLPMQKNRVKMVPKQVFTRAGIKSPPPYSMSIPEAPSCRVKNSNWKWCSNFFPWLWFKNLELLHKNCFKWKGISKFWKWEEWTITTDRDSSNTKLLLDNDESPSKVPDEPQYATTFKVKSEYTCKYC